MRVAVEVRQRTSQPPEDVWSMVWDLAAWPPMPGADLTFRVLEADPPRWLHYTLVGGLPVREHEGAVHLEETPGGGTEIVVREAFRARVWGTGGYLRGRRERALVDVVRMLAPS